MRCTCPRRRTSQRAAVLLVIKDWHNRNLVGIKITMSTHMTTPAQAVHHTHYNTYLHHLLLEVRSIGVGMVLVLVWSLREALGRHNPLLDWHHRIGGCCRGRDQRGKSKGNGGIEGLDGLWEKESRAEDQARKAMSCFEGRTKEWATIIMLFQHGNMMC